MTEWANGRGVLILVHPGSAFTSWRRQVDDDVFENFVAGLEHDLATCTDLVVIDGMLSDGVRISETAAYEEDCFGCEVDDFEL